MPVGNLVVTSDVLNPLHLRRFTVFHAFSTHHNEVPARPGVVDTVATHSEIERQASPGVAVRRPRVRARARRRMLFLVVPILGLAAFALARHESSNSSAEVAPDSEQAPPILPERSPFVSVRDQFPSATEPRVVPASAAPWLEPDDEVLGVVIRGHARAYPLTMLAFHHAINDVIEGVPLLASYCAVLSSGICYDPVVDGKRLIFGVEGAWFGTATLFDRQSGSVWLHVTGTCVSGPVEGKVLARHETGRVTTWAEWRSTHPATDVMAWDERYAPKAGRLGYFTRAGVRAGDPFVPPAMRHSFPRPDGRLLPNAVVYGVVASRLERAYPFDQFRKTTVVEEDLGTFPLTLWFDADSRSAVAFDRRLGEHVMSFVVDDHGAIRDRGTGSRWTLDGLCVEGQFEGRTLRPADGQRAEWYGWSAAHPQTTIWRR